jgi:hypothetical protein
LAEFATQSSGLKQDSGYRNRRRPARGLRLPRPDAARAAHRQRSVEDESRRSASIADQAFSATAEGMKNPGRANDRGIDRQSCVTLRPGETTCPGPDPRAQPSTENRACSSTEPDPPAKPSTELRARETSSKEPARPASTCRVPGHLASPSTGPGRPVRPSQEPEPTARHRHSRARPKRQKRRPPRGPRSNDCAWM